MPPEKVVEVQALIGDAIDNVPGVPGIGVKTAAKLIGEFGDLETLLARAGEVKQPKCREALIEYAGKARLSARLVKLDDNVPLDDAISSFAVRDPDPAKLLPFLRSLEFISLLRRAGAKLGVDEAELGPVLSPSSSGAAGKPAPVLPAESKGCPGAVRERATILQPIDYGNYALVTSAEELDRWIASARDERHAVPLGPNRFWRCDACPDHRHCARGQTGIGLLHSIGRPAQPANSTSRPIHSRLVERGDVLAKLAPALQDDSVLKVAHNIKFLHVLLSQPRHSRCAASTIQC